MAPGTLRLDRAATAALWLVAVCGCPSGTGDGPGPERTPASLQTVLAHADAAFRDADYREAEKAYEQALALQPGQPVVAARLGTCYMKNRAVRKAREFLAAHLESHPADLASRLILARVLIQQGEIEPAGAALRLVLQSEPDNLLARYNLGFIEYRSRNYDEAEIHLKKTLELRPDHPEAHYTLGLVQMARGRHEEAIAELERAVAIDPRHVGARFNLANACARAGRLDESRRHQEVYAELSGGSKAAAEREAQIKASSVRAVEFLLAGKYPEALGEYQALAARFPEYAPLYGHIGRLHLRLGSRREAFAALRRAVELDPGLSEPHYLLSTLYREMGDAESAERELRAFTGLESVPGKSSYY